MALGLPGAAAKVESASVVAHGDVERPGVDYEKNKSAAEDVEEVSAPAESGESSSGETSTAAGNSETAETTAPAAEAAAPAAGDGL